MCTLAIYVDRFATHPLVVAANRDEFLARPAGPPAVLRDRPRVVGGRDLQAGGTWLGISEVGLVAGLLNRRTAAPPVATKRSRGLLMMEVLACSSAADAETLLGAADPTAYNAFTLLVADRTRALVARNHDDGMRITALPRGVHVLSNLDVDEPTCPKVARSHDLFARAGARFAVTGDTAEFRAALATTLADHATALDPRLPDALGALCVHADGFGTRCSSLLFLDRAGHWEHWFADGPPCRTAYAAALVP